MRSRAQVEKQVSRADIANALIRWMENTQTTEGILSYPTVSRFIERCQETGTDYDRFEVWKAWDMLRKAGRISSQPYRWELLDSTPVAVDDKGDLVRNV